MADLINLYRHMKGKAVFVNGTLYQIDEDGIARDVSEGDANKLLQNKAWMIYDPEAAAKREERIQALREEFKGQRGGIQLFTKKGELVDPRAINEAQEKKEAQEVLIAPDDFPTMKSEEPAEVQQEAAPAMADRPVVEDWPDPDMSMTKSYLMDMASAYGLSPQPQTKKQDLIKMIMTAMYDET